MVWFLCVLERELSGEIVIAKEEIYSKGFQEEDVEEANLTQQDNDDESDGSLDFNEDDIYKKKKKKKKKR